MLLYSTRVLGKPIGDLSIRSMGRGDLSRDMYLRRGLPTGCDDYGEPFGCGIGQSIISALSPTVLDCHIGGSPGRRARRGRDRALRHRIRTLPQDALKGISEPTDKERR
jgi:hypothetical protein